MLFLTTTGTQEPDYIALAMVLVMALMVAVMTVRKYLSKKNAAALAAAAPAPVPVQPQPEVPLPTAPGSAGKLKLHDVEPKTAAMLMAIVANKMGKPINELRFLSIKEVK